MIDWNKEVEFKWRHNSWCPVEVKGSSGDFALCKVGLMSFLVDCRDARILWPECRPHEFRNKPVIKEKYLWIKDGKLAGEILWNRPNRVCQSIKLYMEDDEVLSCEVVNP
jgi:hypothetical protein